MKKLTILIIGLFSITNIFSQKNCNDAFSAANYSYAHSTKAYEANNMLHVQEWTMKAIETFSEVEEITANCGCEAAANYAYEGIVATEKSQEQNTYERSRFYAKRAREKAQLMIDALAECTNVLGDDIIAQQDTEDIDSDVLYASNDDNDILNQESLIAEQRALKAQQKEAELIKAKLTVKTTAEEALAMIEAGYVKLAEALGCQSAYEAAKQNYTITKQQLEATNLDETKLLYTEKLNEISENAMLKFADCAQVF